MRQTDLSSYIKTFPKQGKIKSILWFYTNAIIFKTALFPGSRFKVLLLRLFGASVGKSVVIKPHVNIKYPWHLQIGDYSWIGEAVWIDNLALVSIGRNVCLSQGSMLLTGNHDYKDPAFGLITGGITLADGVWIGARAIVNQGILAGSHAVLCCGAVASKHLAAFSVYQGNPAVKIRDRN